MTTGDCDPNTWYGSNQDLTFCGHKEATLDDVTNFGDWEGDSCEVSAIENAFCFDATARAKAKSNSPTGNQAVEATASTCDHEKMGTSGETASEALLGEDWKDHADTEVENTMAAAFGSIPPAVGNEIQQRQPGVNIGCDGRDCVERLTQLMSINDLPDDVVDRLKAQIQINVEESIDDAMLTYSGPENLRELVREMLMDSVDGSLSSLGGTVLVVYEEDQDTTEM